MPSLWDSSEGGHDYAQVTSEYHLGTEHKMCPLCSECLQTAHSLKSPDQCEGSRGRAGGQGPDEDVAECVQV